MNTTIGCQFWQRCMRFALTALAALSLTAAQAQSFEPQTRTNHITAGRLTVIGHGEAQLKPDKADIVIGVVTEDRYSKNAATENTFQTSKVENAVMRMGVQPTDLQTFNYSIQPVSASEPNRPPGLPRPPAIVAYRVTNAVRVTVHNLSRIGEILDAATAAGANTIENIRFGRQDEAVADDEALRRAVADARRKADQIARAAGVQIVGMTSVNEGVTERISPEFYSQPAFSAETAVSPIQPGENTVTANVTIVYETGPIKQASRTHLGKSIAKR
jgi:uncharacterized protein YggE